MRLGVRHLLLSCLAFACANEPNYEGRLCNAGSPCPAGFTCGLDDRCHRDPLFPDGGVRDAEPIDAEPIDAEPTDAEPLDAKPMDAAPLDAEPMDAGPIDAESMDAEPMDAEPIDGGPPDSGEHTLVVRVAGSSDDAMEDPGGPTLVAYGWISLYSLDHWGAVRFTVPNVPRNATIVSAYLDVYCDSDMEDTPNAMIHVEPTANPAPLAERTSDISTRLLSISSVLWSALDTGAGWQRSPNVGPLVQEVVNLTAWGPGSSIMFIFDTQSADDFEFRQWDYDGAGTFAAALSITYRVQ